MTWLKLIAIVIWHGIQEGTMFWTWCNDNWVQLGLVTGYLAILAYHCWAGKQQTRNVSDYLIAGRSLGGWLVALSFVATFVSTNSFIGQAGKSWDVGFVWYVKAAVFVLMCLIAWHIVAPRFVTLALQYQSLTVSDFLGSRYHSPALRRVSAGVILLASLIYLVAIYKGAALALEHFLGLSYQVAAIVVFVIVTTYTVMGGFRSVVLTDALQGLLLVTGAVALFIIVLVESGGPAAILANVRAQDPQLVSWDGKLPLLTLLGLALAGGMKLIVDPRQLSRFYGLRSPESLRTGRWLAPLLIFIVYLCLMPIGAIAHTLIPSDAITDSDQVVPYLLGKTDIFGPVFGSMFLLVLLSAAMSSLDSVLLLAASSVDRDLLMHAGEGAIAINRIRRWVLVLSLLSMVVALNPFGDIVEITAFSGSLYAACFLPTVVIGLFWKGGTPAGALLCVILGSATVLGGFLAKRAGWTHWHEVYAGLTVSTLVYVVSSFFGSSPPAPLLPNTTASMTVQE